GDKCAGLSPTFTPFPRGMPLKQKFHKPLVQIKPQVSQFLQALRQIHEIGLCGVIQNPHRHNHANFPPLGLSPSRPFVK
ncbi:MAG: hypothetical protein WAN62_02310, partial [Candidatus Acidiferrum sp.]